MEYVLGIVGLPQGSLKAVFSPLGILLRPVRSLMRLRISRSLWLLISNGASHIHDHFIPNHRNNYHPHLLGHRSLALMSGLLLAVKIFTLSVIAIGPVAPAFSSAITESNIISLTNQSRVSYGLGILTQNSILDVAAQAKANDMLAKGYFAHVTPDGHSPWDFISSAGYNYLSAGENLAVNFTEAENVETAWMNSPGHKANILNKNFEQIGIGISEGEYQGHTAIFVVQMFGTPAEQKVALSDKPTIVQKTAVPVPQASAAASVAGAEVKTAPQPQPVNVQSGEVKLHEGKVNILARVEGPAVKVVAYFGEQAVMLSPKDQNTWAGQVATASLVQSGQTVTIKAFGMQGQSAKMQLADFSAGTIQNYSPNVAIPAGTVSFFGLKFDPKSFEAKFYLFFIAGMLASLILAIAIKRHIQHVLLVANSSFVVIFACLLYWAR